MKRNSKKTPRKTQSDKPTSAGVAGAGASAPAPLGGAEKNSQSPIADSRVEILVPMQPLELLLPYQSKWVNDDARFKIGMMSRQVGKDFSSGAEGVRDCFAHELQKSRIDWLIAAPSERQSLESLDKWKQWAEAFKLAIEDIEEEREGGSETLLKSATIVFPGGSRIIAVPGKPDTVRGYSANVLMTEFAFFENPDLTWRAVLPSITNPLKGGAKKVRLISTPNGIGNKFHDLWSKNFEVKGSKWSCHRVTIYDAVKQGLPVDIEELKAALDDPDGWAQEFECQFIDAQGVLLPYELIALCESPEATTSVPAEFWFTRQQFPVDLGIDFGRKKDLTVCWALQQVGDVGHTREVLELPKMSTPKQEEILRPRIAQARRVCLDYTGPGVGLGDYLVERYGQWDPEKHLFGKVELCNFTNTLKVDIFSKLRMAFEQKRLRIPANRTIREDLHSMNRVTTPNGSVTYKAPHTADGHADRATALALAVRAQSQGGGGAITDMKGIRTGHNASGTGLALPTFQPWSLS